MRKKDLLILSHLRKNARETLTDMSKKTCIAVSTIYDRLKLFETTMIKKHTAIINFNEIGFNSRAVIILSVEREMREDVRKCLEKDYHVNNVFKINNGYDFMLEAVFRSIKEMEEFIEKIDTKFKIKQKHVYYIIDDIKREEFLSDPDMLGMISEIRMDP